MLLRRLCRGLVAPGMGVALVLGLFALAFAVTSVWRERANLERLSLEERSTDARALESDTNVALNAIAESMLKTVAVGRLTDQAPEAAAVRQAMQETLARYTLLRSMTVVDDEGQVQFSSEDGAAGTRLPITSLGTMPQADAVTMGLRLPVRNLSDLLLPAGSPQRHSALPLLLRIPRGESRSWYLVSLVSLEALTLKHIRLLGNGEDRSALLSYEGVVLDHNAAGAIEPGVSARHLPPFRDFLPSREQGAYLGLGMDGTLTVAAFRTLAQWPLVVLVERDYSHLRKKLFQSAMWDGLVLLIAWFAIGMYAWLVNRSQAKEKIAQAEAEVLNRQVAENEQRWKLALEAAGEGVWDLHLDTGALVSSPKVMSLLGYSPGEVGGALRQWFALVHPKDRRPARSAIADQMSRRAVALRIEIRVRRKDGAWCWLLVRGNAAGPTGPWGRPERIVGTLVDITEQREAEDALRASQARRQALLDSALDGIITIDSSGCVVDFNAVAEGMFGRSQAEVQGMSMHDFIVPAHMRNSHAAGMARYIATGQSSMLRRRIEVEALRADGSTFPVELTVVPVRVGDEELFTATLRDITERKRVENELRESEARARETFEQAAVGMLHQSLDNRYLHVNNTMCGFLGMSREEFLALSPEQLLHADHVQEVTQDMARLRSGEATIVQNEVQVRRHGGSYLWVRITGSLAHAAESGLRYIICVVEDIDERKRLDHQRMLLGRQNDLVTAELKRQRQALDEHTLVSVLDDNLFVRYANSKLCAITGYLEDELVGQRHPGFSEDNSQWIADNPIEIRNELALCVNSGQVWRGEIQQRHKNGSTLWAATTVVPMLGGDGSLQELFVLQTDISRRIAAEQAAKEAHDREILMGARIQQSLLSTVLDQRLPRTWLSAVTRPSQGVEGDFLHVLTVGNDCVDVVTADVMGKGVGAALVGAAAKMQLVQCMAHLMADPIHHGRPEPAVVVAEWHRAILPSLEQLGAFITLSYVRIDSAADSVTWVGCGHEEPLLVRSDGHVATLSNQHPPVGVLSDVSYTQDTLPMRPDDALLSYSDGITDAIKPDGTRVGREVLAQSVRRLVSHCKAPGAVLHVMMRELLGPHVQAVDDSSMLLLVRTDETAMASRRELPCSVDALPDVRGLIEARCAEASLEETKAGLFSVACIEGFTNIVRHAQGRMDGSKIELLVQRDVDKIQVDFVYLGDEVKLPPIREPDLSDYPEGGFGLSIMRMATDELVHDHRDGINTISLIKHLAEV